MSRALGWPERHSLGPAELRHIASVLERLDSHQPQAGMRWVVDVVAPDQVWALSPDTWNDVPESELEQQLERMTTVKPPDPDGHYCPCGGSKHFHRTPPPRDKEVIPEAVQARQADWAIQTIPQEGAPFILYRGVLVGRLYGGAPISEMLDRLNGPTYTEYHNSTHAEHERET